MNDLVNIKNYIPNDSDIGKRVLNLYRVSTDRQVTYNENNEADIPMQRRECRRFLEQQGWVLVHEELEDGISGHKVRADKRDSIQTVKELALDKKFDILLVFMLDRIGRIADETPFVVEWLVENGVRVWSAKEGESRFDNHTDRLTNYIYYWQADGESRKISIRTKAGLGVLVEDGHYKGGSPPYGYNLVKSGRLDKKGHEKKNLSVCEDEAIIVQKIFDLYVRQGYGMHKIVMALDEQGIKTRKGKMFQTTTIRHILRNLTYTGILRSGESRSPMIEDLQIIPPQVFERVQEVMNTRRSDDLNNRKYPRKMENRLLLNGKIYCADCGAALIVGANGKFIEENGVKLKLLRYQCISKARKRKECHGQSTYIYHKVDGAVDEILQLLFSQLKNIPKSEVVNSGLAARQKEQLSRYKAADRDFDKAAAGLAELKGEVLKAIRGESKFTPELLSGLIEESEKQLTNAETVRNNLKRELEDCKRQAEEIQAQYDEVVSWAELYDSAEHKAKKMIIANLINRIEISRGYRIDIDFNIELEHFGISKPRLIECISA
ncbi:MAG: recombinase family protein [Oscillospiraceae bacterium]|nr:recombinase family protein [Oscillospiraceae bacterium]